MATLAKAAESPPPLPGEGVGVHKLPGHWVLARLGKRVLRPGGRQLSRQMISALGIGEHDDVIEFAPGLGATARLVLAQNPRSYTAVERDAQAAKLVERNLQCPSRRCIQGHAESTGLADACATVVFGEAMLSMQPDSQKIKILAEARRLLRTSGLYGIHELCLLPDDLAAERRDEIERDLSQAIHVGVRPLTVRAWRELLEQAGFDVESQATVPMHLLEPRRLLADEGLANTLRILWRAARDHEARKRMLEMRGAFRKHASHLGAVMIVAKKSV